MFSYSLQSIDARIPGNFADFVQRRKRQNRKGALLLAHSSSEIKGQQNLIGLSWPDKSDHLLSILLKGLILLLPEFMLSAHMDVCMSISDHLAFANKSILQIIWYTVA